MLRLPALALVALAVTRVVVGTPGQILSQQANGHGAAKQLLGTVHTALVRLPELPWLLAGALLAAVVLPALRGRAWWIGAALTALLALLLVPAGPLLLLALLLVLVLANLHGGARPLELLAAVPGMELLLPLPVLRRAGLGGRGQRVLALLSTLVLTSSWFLADSYASTERYARAVTAWDPDRSAPWAERIDVAAPGVHCEFHDVDIVGQHAVVVAEGDPSLRAYPLAGGPPARTPLPPVWEPYGGVTLDSETDPRTGLTWFVDGPETVTSARLDDDGAWQRVGRSARVQPPLHHTYTALVPERHDLVLLTVNTASGPPDPYVGIIDLDSPGTVQRRPLQSSDGRALPNFRELAWVPTIQRFAVAPAFGDELWLVDPWAGRAEPWLTVPTLNGKLVWAEEQERLYMTLPDQLRLWVIDPVAGRVERTIPTQPGARALAIDEERGLLLTGSVLTGVVLVQRLEDGWPTRAIGTVMPMMRELALIPGQPQAMLSTWGSLYKITYD